MKKIKKIILKWTVGIMSFAILFLVSCETNQVKTETKPEIDKPDTNSVISNETKPIQVDTIKPIVKPDVKPAKKPKPIKKDSIVRPEKPTTVCKYGVNYIDNK